MLFVVVGRLFGGIGIGGVCMSCLFDLLCVVFLCYCLCLLLMILLLWIMMLVGIVLLGLFGGFFIVVVLVGVVGLG